jgi:hypothetical protein
MPSSTILKADFHIHSHFSADSDMAPETIIKTAKQRGLDIIAVTDHNTIRGGLETQKIAKALIVFVGAEIKTKVGEVIGLNLKKDVPPYLSLAETCSLIRGQGGLVFIPHPFDKFRSGIGKEMEKIIDFVDAVEVFNARTMANRFNKEAMEFAQKHKLPFFAGSDAHFTNELGMAFMLIDSKKDKKSVLEAVMAGKVKIVGKKSGVLPHWKTFLTKMNRKV